MGTHGAEMLPPLPVTQRGEMPTPANCASSSGGFLTALHGSCCALLCPRARLALPCSMLATQGCCWLSCAEGAAGTRSDVPSCPGNLLGQRRHLLTAPDCGTLLCSESERFLGACRGCGLPAPRDVLPPPLAPWQADGRCRGQHRRALVQSLFVLYRAASAAHLGGPGAAIRQLVRREEPGGCRLCTRRGSRGEMGAWKP